jgi:hypothetical protein
LLWAGIVSIGYVVLAYRIVTAERTDPPGVLVYVAVSGIIGLICLIGLVGAGAVVATQLEYALRRGRSSLYPDAVLVTGLAAILSMVERESAKWTNLDFKRQLMSEIEVVAVCIERDLPHRLRTGDVTTDAWVRERVRQMAAALRGLKKWISTPCRTRGVASSGR